MSFTVLLIPGIFLAWNISGTSFQTGITFHSMMICAKIIGLNRPNGIGEDFQMFRYYLPLEKRR